MWLDAPDALDAPNARTLLAQFPDAAAVFVVGDFNGWCTASNPMHVRDDGLWEAQLPDHARGGRIAFWVWECGHLGGRLCWQDRASVSGAV